MKKDGKPKLHFLYGLCIKILVTVICAVLIAGALFYIRKRYESRRFAALSAMVSGEIMHCAELTTVKAVYSDIVSLKRKEMLGMAKSYSIIRYSGTVRAGIEDFSSLSFTVGKDLRSIKVVLPPVRVLANDISSMEVFDEHNNIFAPISSREIFEHITGAKNNMEQTFIAQGLIAEAEVQAVSVVRRVLSAMGFKQIEVFLSPK